MWKVDINREMGFFWKGKFFLFLRCVIYCFFFKVDFCGVGKDFIEKRKKKVRISEELRKYKELVKRSLYFNELIMYR